RATLVPGVMLENRHLYVSLYLVLGVVDSQDFACFAMAQNRRANYVSSTWSTGGSRLIYSLCKR
ncbi:hypothetical protein, partial [Paraburkholderia dipogonis]